MSHPVLIVEDDADIRETVRMVVEHAGHLVQCVDDGEQALAWLRSRSEADEPCVVLVDTLMPSMNGAQLAAAMRHTDTLAAIPVVIMCTGSELPAAHEAPNVVRVLWKPFSIDTLLEVIEERCPMADERRGPLPRREPPGPYLERGG